MSYHIAINFLEISVIFLKQKCTNYIVWSNCIVARPFLSREIQAILYFWEQCLSPNLIDAQAEQRMAYGRMAYGLFCTTAYATVVMEMRLRLCVRACERTVWHFFVASRHSTCRTYDVRTDHMSKLWTKLSAEFSVCGLSWTDGTWFDGMGSQGWPCPVLSWLTYQASAINRQRMDLPKEATAFITSSKAQLSSFDIFEKLVVGGWMASDKYDDTWDTKQHMNSEIWDRPHISDLRKSTK